MSTVKFRLIWTNVSEETLEIVQPETNELPITAMFVDGSGRNEQSL